MPDLRILQILQPAPEGEEMIYLHRSPSPLPQTRTVIKAGSITFERTQPDERAARRRWRECCPPPGSVIGAGWGE